MQLLFSGAIPSREEVRGVTAVLGILDVETGEILHLCEYKTPPELMAAKKMQFTGFFMTDGQIYACSNTEIVRFDDWPPSEPAGRITIPGFNDLHHCIPWDGGLAVANTGLETVDHVSLEGDLIQRWDLLDGYPEARRIDPDLDYRRIPDTQPHRIHPNHLWVRDGELWATGLKDPGAVRVTGDRRKIAFDTGRPHDGPHDGRYIRGQLAFTTVRGFVVLVDPDSLEVVASPRSRADDARHQIARMVSWPLRGSARSEPVLRRLLDPSVFAMARVRVPDQARPQEGTEPDRSLRRRARERWSRAS